MSDSGQKRDGFGIGELGNVPETTAADELAAAQLQPQRRVVEWGECQRCHQRVPKRQLMSASRGTVCPDCFDAWAD